MERMTSLRPLKVLDGITLYQTMLCVLSARISSDVHPVQSPITQLNTGVINMHRYNCQPLTIAIIVIFFSGYLLTCKAVYKKIPYFNLAIAMMVSVI